ncbi:MAG: dihydroorotase [Treponema sp.]|nr:dihydroorotase [Treponema sp.]
MKTVLKNFRIVDETTDMIGTVILEDGIITHVLPAHAEVHASAQTVAQTAALIIDGEKIAGKTNTGADDCGKGNQNFLPVLMPAFIDLHAHFRDPGFPLKENLESASLAAAAGGYTTVVCMANTNPVIDNYELACELKKRSDAIGLIDLYPVLSLTRGMEGRELSAIADMAPGQIVPVMLSEDGKDITDDSLFLRAMEQAARFGLPVSCHCDFGGQQAEAQKKAGDPRGVYSRTEENNAVSRVIKLGKEAGCHIHIAHVSTKEAIEAIRAAKNKGRIKLTCEAMPHNFFLTDDDAKRMGEETFGRVNPPLRTPADIQALKLAIRDHVIDAIATDHAPHTNSDKINGAPGFSGLETAFAASYTKLVMPEPAAQKSGLINLQALSSLMSAKPANIIGLAGNSGGRSCSPGRGLIKPGMAADLVLVDTETSWIVNPQLLKTKGKNSAFTGIKLFGKILMTIRNGRIVYQL